MQSIKEEYIVYEQKENITIRQHVYKRNIV